MPLFEFRCSSCDHLEEVLQKYNDPAPGVCAACGESGSLSKEVSLTSFQLKGGGWYKDLYSSSAKESDKGDKKDSSTPAQSKDSGSGGNSGGSGSSNSSGSSSGSGGSSSSGGSGGSSSAGSGGSGGSKSAAA